MFKLKQCGCHVRLCISVRDTVQQHCFIGIICTATLIGIICTATLIGIICSIVYCSISISHCIRNKHNYVV